MASTVERGPRRAPSVRWAAALGGLALLLLGCTSDGDDATAGPGGGQETTTGEAADAASVAELTLVVGHDDGAADLASAADAVVARFEAAGHEEAAATVQGDSIVLAPGPGPLAPAAVEALATTSGVVALRPVCAVLPPTGTGSQAPAPVAVPGCAPGPADAPDGDLCAATDSSATVLATCEHDVEVARYLLGPTAIDGEGVASADAGAQENADAWSVVLSLEPSAADDFAALAEQCFEGAATCPGADVGTSGQIAIVVDGRVLTAPTVQTPSLERDLVVISGGLDEAEARALAVVLDAGVVLPVPLSVRG